MLITDIVLDKWEQESSNNFARNAETPSDYRVLELIYELRKARAGSNPAEDTLMAVELADYNRKLKDAYELIGRLADDLNTFMKK